MKKAPLIFTFIWVLSLAGTHVFAQGKMKEVPAAQRAKLQTERMVSSLKLDEEQTKKVGQINLIYAQKMDPVIQGTGSKMSRLRAFKSISKAKEAELKGVLTKEQFGQFQQQQQAMKDQLRKQRR
jgi:hypothetical protein